MLSISVGLKHARRHRAGTVAWRTRIHILYTCSSMYQFALLNNAAKKISGRINRTAAAPLRLVQNEHLQRVYLTKHVVRP